MRDDLKQRHSYNTYCIVTRANFSKCVRFKVFLTTVPLTEGGVQYDSSPWTEVSFCTRKLCTGLGISVLVPLSSKDEGADCTLLCLPLSAAEVAQWHGKKLYL